MKVSFKFLLSVLPILLGLFLASCGEEEESAQALVTADMRVDNFALIDQNGDFHNLYYYSDAPAIVLFIQGNACPIVRNALTDLKAVRDQFKEEGVVFFMLNSNLQDNREKIQEEAKAYDIDFPILIDQTQLVGEGLDLHRTAEAIVINTDTWQMAYRGPINDRIGYESQRQEAKDNYLADAIQAVLKGEEISDAVVKGKGCLIKFAKNDKELHAQISYSETIAPLLKENCTQCHIKGGIAPWAMDSYETVFGWSRMMREVLRSKRMPPWQADPHYGSFANDISLTTAEIQTLVHWIEAGAPRGEGEDPLLAVKQEPAKWELGEPDILVQLDPEEVPASGVLDYRYQTVALELDKTVWANGIQVIPGNRAVLHHLLVSINYPEGFQPPMDQRDRWLDGLFASWAPGTEVEQFPEGTGRILPKGSKLLFQLHYTTNGKEEVDASKIGIYTQDTKPQKEYLIVGPFNPQLKIPPHEKAYQSFAKEVFDQEFTLYGMAPHMHFRGKSMKFVATYPDGAKEVLLNVPNYNFNWQRYYLLEEPKVLPAGTAITCEAYFDNSAQNTFNPHPDQEVYWGEQSFDEMHIGYMSFHYGRLGAEQLSMKE